MFSLTASGFDPIDTYETEEWTTTITTVTTTSVDRRTTVAPSVLTTTIEFYANSTHVVLNVFKYNVAIGIISGFLVVFGMYLC